MILKILGLSCVSGLLMFAGGEGNKQIKRIGVPLTVLATMWLLKMNMLWYFWIIQFGLLYFSLTTYFSELMGSKDDVEWGEWAISGATCGFALLPYAISSGHWIGWGIRLITLAFLWWIWSEKFGDVFIESFGRGMFIILTIPILLLK